MTSPSPLTAALLLAASLTCILPLVAATPNPEQHGENGTCADFNALFLAHGLQLEAIPVEGGTGYNATFEGGQALYIDFYDPTGSQIGDNARNPLITPLGATDATICVGANGGGWPDLPAPDATWTYQDGF